MKHRCYLSFLLILTLILALPLSASADEREAVVGSVRNLTGAPSIERGGRVQSVAVGDHLFMGDTLITASNSTLGVIFRDDTSIALGPSSRISIDEFVFSPADKNVSFLTSLQKGSALFVTGQMAKVAPEKLIVQTPVSAIGIRGTRFLVKVD